MLVINYLCPEKKNVIHVVSHINYASLMDLYEAGEFWKRGHTVMFGKQTCSAPAKIGDHANETIWNKRIEGPVAFAGL